MWASYLLNLDDLSRKKCPQIISNLGECFPQKVLAWPKCLWSHIGDGSFEADTPNGINRTGFDELAFTRLEQLSSKPFVLSEFL